MISSFQYVVCALGYLGERVRKLEWLHFIIMCYVNCPLGQEVGF